MFRLFSLPAQARLLLALCCCVLALVPAQAAVRITFWSHEFGNSFPHAFFSVDGTLDAGGLAIHESYGFTAKAITPAILMGSVPGRIDVTAPKYIDSSNAHFTLTITDAQYAEVKKLVGEWGVDGDSHYNLNRRNCIHFVAEAMRRSGLDVVEPKALMKKPRSFTQSIAARNPALVTSLEMPARTYHLRYGRPAAGAPVVADAMLLPPAQQPMPVR